MSETLHVYVSFLGKQVYSNKVIYKLTPTTMLQVMSLQYLFWLNSASIKT